MALQGSQVASHFQQQASLCGNLIDKHRGLIGHLQEQDAVLVKQLEAARRELASVYLKALTDEDLARVARLTGFQGFVRRDPRMALAQERKVLQSSIAKIEADDRYARRDELAGPNGSLTQELASSRETLAPLQAECEKFETLVEFQTLVDIGYDTPSFNEKWWHASYWKHWAAGDRICKELGMADFGDDVLPAYNKIAEPRNFMRSEVERLEKELDAIHEMVRQHDQMADRLTHLDEIYVEEAQDFLGEHLVNADAALLEQWAQGEPDMLRAVQMGVRKLAGLQAKRTFLADFGQGSNQMIAQLRERQQKAQLKAQKFQRPKNYYSTFPSSVVDDSFTQKSTAMQAQVDKLEQRVDKLVQNQNYAAFDLRNDQQLWWWYFMQAPPPRYAPYLYDYYSRRPEITVVTDPDFADGGPDPGEAAARAFVARDAEQDGGYLS